MWLRVRDAYRVHMPTQRLCLKSLVGISLSVRDKYRGHMPTRCFFLKRWVGMWLRVRGRLPQPHAYDDDDDELCQSLRFDIWGHFSAKCIVGSFLWSCWVGFRTMRKRPDPTQVP